MHGQSGDDMNKFVPLFAHACRRQTDRFPASLSADYIQLYIRQITAKKSFKK